MNIYMKKCEHRFLKKKNKCVKSYCSEVCDVGVGVCSFLKLKNAFERMYTHAQIQIRLYLLWSKCVLNCAIYLCCSQHLYVISRWGEHVCLFIFFVHFFHTALIDAHAYAWFWIATTIHLVLYNMYHISITLLLLKSMGSEK